MTFLESMEEMWEETKEWGASAWENITEFMSTYYILVIGLLVLIIAAVVVVKLVKKMPKKHLSITEMYDSNGRKIDD